MSQIFVVFGVVLFFYCALCVLLFLLAFVCILEVDRARDGLRRRCVFFIMSGKDIPRFDIYSPSVNP